MSKLRFKKVDIYFIWTAITKSEISEETIKSLTEISYEKLDRRIFHTRYIEAAKNIARIESPPMTIKGVDDYSFKNIPWPEGSVKKSLFEKFVEKRAQIINNKKFDLELWLFPENGVIFQAKIGPIEETSTEDLLAFINGILDFNARILFEDNETLTLKEVFRKKI